MVPILTITAELQLLSYEEGGRSLPIKKGQIYRPNHFFRDLNDNCTAPCLWIGEIFLLEDELLNPSERAIVSIHFMYHPILEMLFKQNVEWEIYEWPHKVATAKLITLI